MEINELNNKIVIIRDSYKKTLLKNICDFKTLINIKIITLNELKKKYCFDYNKECIYYVCNKYNVVYDIAKTYIENLYYVNNESDNEQIRFLYNLKNELLEKKLIKVNYLFKEFLKNKEILLYNLGYVDKFYSNIFNEIKSFSKVNEYNYENEEGKKILYIADNQEEEISFVASTICNLIKSGIDINKIKLSNVNEEYYFVIKKIFKLFNIPINLKSNYVLSGTFLVNKFKELYSNNMEEVFNKLKIFINTNEDNNIYSQLINIVNDYSFIDDYEKVKQLIYNDIDNTYIKLNKLSNAVEIIDFESIPNNDEYVILINFNEGIIPVNHKDEDYLNDKNKKELNISTSDELNYNDVKNIQNNIKYSKHVMLTCSTHNNSGEIYKSSAYSSLFIDIKKVKITYNDSNSFNKLKLVGLKDENVKFGSISEDLVLLNSTYKDEKYLTYNNQYKKISVDKLKIYLDNHLTLSYTSINDYYKCKFKYYLNYILKINKYEESFEINIGNIYHKILSECFVENYDFNKRFDEEVSKCTYSFNNMEKFFIKKLKKELFYIIDIIKKQSKYTQLNKNMYEKVIIIEVDKNLNINFKGIIDKILYDEINDETIVSIIDYKTGNPSVNIKNINYGIDMQLPIYVYLIKNMREFNNIKIGGFYLQKLLSAYKNDNEKINNLKLQGYTNLDLNIIKYVDSSYKDSSIIKGLKMSKDGFYTYSKVISDDEINNLTALVEEKIKQAGKDIFDASFEINPKSINNQLIGCNNCKYKDICYMNNKDIVILEDLAGDNNE